MVKGILWPGAFVPCAVVTHVSAIPQTAVHHPIRGPWTPLLDMETSVSPEALYDYGIGRLSPFFYSFL